MRRPDGTEALGSRHVAQAHPRRDRGLAEAPRHRLCRSLPASRLRPAHADRRGAGGARYGRALGRSEVKNIGRIESVQPRYNLLFRSFERDLLPLCAEEAIAVIPYNPLAGGLLTGKHDRKAPPPEG